VYLATYSLGVDHKKCFNLEQIAKIKQSRKSRELFTLVCEEKEKGKSDMSYFSSSK
jgi:hypothetical protein